MTAELERLNALPLDEAERQFLQCCGSTNWSRRMSRLRPFRDRRELLESADRVWWELRPEDWLEAFSRHPRIGERAASTAGSAQARPWSDEEQSGTQSATQGVLAALAEANRAYRDRFGYIFIVCATGKTGDEMLALLRQRLQNEPGAELCIAAEEQGRITHLRLEKLLASE